MHYADHVDIAERELATIVEAINAGPLDARVPSCPDYDVRELARHVGRVCGFWISPIHDGRATEGPSLPAMPDDAPARWVNERRADLIALLRESSPDDPCWTFSQSDQTVGWVARRVAHEFTVHRVDMQLARGLAEPIDPAVACDGIDEALDTANARVELGRVDRHHGNGETMHLHATDCDGEWLVTLTPQRIEFTHEHAKGDLAIRASASDLELLLYSRPTSGEVQTFGDETVLETFYRGFTF